MPNPLPPKPPIRPEFPEDSGRPPGAWLAILLTSGGVLLAVVALSFLTLGWFAPVLAVVAVVGGIVLFHWVVWGWWMQKLLEEAQAEDEERGS
jgi:uncharacterized membrane protein YphA (DoxX/SURF4 family)